MLFFQLLATIFMAFAVHRIVTRYRAELLPKSEMVVWCVFWLLVAVAIWWPRGTDIIARVLGVSRGADVIFAGSIAVIFYMLFGILSHVHRLQRELTQLVRSLAIHNADSKSEQEKKS